MTAANYPSENPKHRRADQMVHLFGFFATLICGAVLLHLTCATYPAATIWAVIIYIACLLFSNLASAAYHFLPWHAQRQTLRRIDHAAIYFSITGTFTPSFIYAGVGWTHILLGFCWALTFVGALSKIIGREVKTKWSTASYLGLGALGLAAIPGLRDVPSATVYFVLAGAVSYVIGAAIYSRKTIPFRYSIWHSFGNLGGLLMFAGIWTLLAA